jgi:hypothetical protein
MTTFTVVTPSYAGDYELCRDLHSSVRDNTSDDTTHHIIVPKRDLPLFSHLEGARCVVRSEDDVLPRHMWRVPTTSMRMNFLRPFPPVRGWVTQQLVKLAAAAEADTDVVVLMDSDVVLIRSLAPDELLHHGSLPLYRLDAGVHSQLRRHVLWHDAARRLLGRDPLPPPLPDYVSSFMFWEPEIVRALRRRVEAVNRANWLDVIGSQLHISEWTLYGVFADEFLPASSVMHTTDTRCHSYWDTVPLGVREATTFVEHAKATDVAVMISSKSRTSSTARRTALERHRRMTATTPGGSEG